MIDQPDGILPILTFDKKSTWQDVLSLAHPHLDSPGLERLKAAVSKTAKTVVVERHYIDKDYRDTFSKYHSKKFHTPDARCIRLHFFNRIIDRKMLAQSDRILAKGYLGYSVVRPVRPNCIGRTMLHPKGRRDVAGMMSLCNETVTIQGSELKIAGFPFISQDADATVCAQATLWMLMRYYSNRYPIYPEVYPIQIGDLTRDYSVGRMLPTAGLYVWQMAEALRQINFASVIYNRSEFKPDFEHLLYTYIESGIPVLAAFKNHVVVLFGHRSDYTSVSSSIPTRSPDFIFSSEFNQAFIGNDDNGIPYQTLQETAQGVPWAEMYGGGGFFSTKEIQQFVAPLPERVFLAAENFEKLVTTFLLSKELGYINWSPRLKAEGMPVLRLFLTTGKSFKKRIGVRDNMGHDLVAAVYRDLPLPHFIWVCEVSNRTIYPDKVLGEVIWDATRNPHEPKGFLAVHYPEILVFDWGSALNSESDLVQFDLGSGVEYPIYTHNLEEVS